MEDNTVIIKLLTILIIDFTIIHLNNVKGLLYLINDLIINFEIFKSNICVALKFRT